MEHPQATQLIVIPCCSSLLTLIPVLVHVTETMQAPECIQIWDYMRRLQR